jgi:uncharacterized protein (TIGR03435 family)
MIAALAIVAIPLRSQTVPTKRSFGRVFIRPSSSNPMRGGGTRGDQYTMSGASLRMLLESAYQRPAAGVATGLQIFGGPKWIDSDRWDIHATLDCSGGAMPGEWVQSMVQSMLEDRFQLQAHMESRALPIYNLVVAKGGPKLRVSADQTPPEPARTQPQPCSETGLSPFAVVRSEPHGNPFDPTFVMPRGSIEMMINGSAMTLQGSAVPLSSVIRLLRGQIGTPIIDKTNLKGLFDLDFHLVVSSKVVSLQDLRKKDQQRVPNESRLYLAAIQELGLSLEPAEGPVEVLVVDSVQKPAAH